ncbi:CheY-like superfamily [Penicillium angulare]|uniref:CheY-like superfamily n=1 Tax=Penicillium angulare TaxID=116970 RepID=UPI0025400596|nr:CheY-like superfamily [Penicillium angulare]KAJ5291993.1 CheY-like superfamily [Penicillium angulare]
MPILNGMAATKAIRDIEFQRSDSRIPILAVSASLLERDETSYIDTGFDGWVMKPIDFARLKILLNGVRDPEARRGPDGDRDWEKGGWFVQ